MQQGATNLRHRRSIRLRGYNYSQGGIYFVTICAFRMKTLFGRIDRGKLAPNALGRIVQAEWLRTPWIRAGVELDLFVLMPNHFHGIVILHPGCRGVQQHARIPGTAQLHSPTKTLGALVRGFKAATTSRINALRGTPGEPVWQRNYYEHIVRNGKDLEDIRRYILINPARWELERSNRPNRSAPGVLPYAPTARKQAPTETDAAARPHE